MAEHESYEVREVENSKTHEKREKQQEEVGESEEEFESGEEEEREVRDSGLQPGQFQVQPSEEPSSLPLSVAETRESDLGTLARPSAHQFSGALAISSSQSRGGTEFEEQVGVSHVGVSTSLTTQTAPVQTQNQLQLSASLIPLSEESPTSVTQSISSAPSPKLLAKKFSPPTTNSEGKPEQNQKNSSGFKKQSSGPTLKTSASDGFNWRKYGQKQVKSPKGFRSYYRCTYSECCAKKIECCDHSGQVTDVVYKSQHNHDPPRKISSTKESKCTPSSVSVVKNVVAEHSCRIMNGTDPSTSSKEPAQETSFISERKRQYSSDSNGNGEVIVKEEQSNEPEPKRRLKKDNLEYSGSLLKPGKKPKFVVHAAGDVGISGDGYRWRKYGQKMVKGNPHPRNYYRCTSAGCPVRKHIETAVDNSNAVIITYKGVHDHDMPVPKKRHGPPSAPLVAAASPASMNNMQVQKSDRSQNQKPSTQWSVDTEGELTGEALDLGGEKAMESARTLLSIGFEIKPC